MTNLLYLYYRAEDQMKVMVVEKYHHIATQCSKEPNCVPQCTASECRFLCRHQVTCTCWDYKEGHLCKHCHKVRARIDDESDATCDGTSLPPLLSFETVYINQ